MTAKDPHELYRRGRFREASSALQSEKNTLSARVLECQIDLDVGRWPKALQAASSLSSGPLTPEQRAVVKAVMGAAELSRWNLPAALDAFQEARAAAVAAEDLTLEAEVWARLCIFATERLGMEAGIGFLPELRHLALRSGSRIASLSLRYLRAVLSMRAGHYLHAEQEIEAGLVHLDAAPNLYWEGRFALLRSAIKSYQGLLQQSQVQANLAFAKSTESGAESLAGAAAANLAQLAVATGNLTSASQTLQWARKASNVGQSVRIALADTSAQLGIANGDLKVAEGYLAVVENLDPDAVSDQALWHGLTRIRYAIRTGDPASGARVAADLLPRVERAADGNLASRMRLLAAESLLLADRHAEAFEMLRQVSLADLSPSAEVLAETARVYGRLAASTDAPLSLRQFERAARVFCRLGNITAANEAVRNASDVRTQRDPQGAECGAGWHGPDAYDETHPTPVHVRPTTGDGAVAATAVQDLTAVLDQLAYPSIAGYDLLQVLADSRATASATLVSRAEGGTRTLAWIGEDHGPPGLLGAESALEIPLGDQHGQEFVVVAALPDGAGATITLLTLSRLVAQARDMHRTRVQERERSSLWPEHTPELQLGLVATSVAMQNVVRLVKRAATSPVTVLITGETGTGKELLARGLHDASPRKDKPFVPFNCAAVPKDLLDSQLFGHRRGAFTGALEASGGVIRAAGGGTLFLDEVGEIPLEMQPKLLRFLELGEIHPLGEPRPIHVDVRVVAATNANLEELVAERKFREDLYYRLNVVRVTVPPLRDRREEVPTLVDYFLQKFSEDFHKPGLRIADETLEYLTLYAWPGNVRELGNEMRRMVALSEPGAVLMPDHLSPTLAASRRTRPASEIALTENEMIVRIDQPLPAVHEHVERRMIIRAMEVSGGRVEDAASLLGLSRKGLYLKRQRLGMD